MTKKPPPLNFIRSFEAAARHLSFTRAATELGCTQAAVSTHIRSLERLLGVDLFIRYPRSLALTETGAAYLPTLRQALRMIDTATETVQINSKHKTVRIAAPISLAENWIAPRISAFSRANPDIQLIVHGTVWEEDVPDCDLTIYMRRAADHPSGANVLFHESVALLCSPHLAKTIDSKAAFLTAPKLIVSGRQEYWSVIAACFDLPVEALELSGSDRVNSSNIALEMAAHDGGLIALPLELAGAYLKRNLLVEPFDLRPPSPWVYCFKHAQDRPSHAASLVLESILQHTPPVTA
ncbi:MAG: LysR family transcriptional regulator [Pseudomonadota bacterium]